MPRKPFELDRFDDPLAALPVETGVGPWVLEKHGYLARYVHATWGARNNFGHATFIDVFSGPGRLQLRDEPFTRAGGACLVWGCAAQHAGAFNDVYIGDADPAKLEACQQRLAAMGAPVRAQCAPALERAQAIVRQMPAKSLTLAYLDPYDLSSLEFELIRTLAGLSHVDIVLHFSVMDLRRDMPNEFARIEARFDVVAPGWRDVVLPASMSKHERFERFFAHWSTLVSQQLGFHVSHRKPLMKNSVGGQLYRLVMLSRNPMADRIWNDVALGPNKELF